MIGTVAAGSSEPRGLTLTRTGANVAVYSKHAEAIDLCLFDAQGADEIARITLHWRSGDVFHAHVDGLTEGQLYGFRAHGPFDPLRGHRFNAAKLLVDPYALELDRPFALCDAMFAYRGDDDLSLDATDSAPVMPKAIARSKVMADLGSRPRHPLSRTILYELHVKGFTRTHPDIPENLRGTFAGLAHPVAVAHLTRLGVTAVEIMPCAAFVDERHLRGLGLANYWGYNPIALMAPDPRLAPGGWSEVRAAVDALHRAGIEVILDVVFNHSGESDELGPTLSLRGLDNASYYRLRGDDPRYYVNDAGCGNVLALERAEPLRLALDALRVWADCGGVDGFRFDLATTLARLPEGFSAEAPFLSALRQDPSLRELKLIAEPWDLGPGGYRLGEFPEPFAEWNDRFRDCARRFWRGDPIGVGDFATRLSGSQDAFAARGPSNSVNFIVAHDGFTLRDLVSYAAKHNEANGEDNRDGTNENFSWNCGVEGPVADSDIVAARAKDQRNLLATLLLARGTPMLAMGAELGCTQGGNNNAYAQDNTTSWIDWSAADDALIDFTARLIALRKAAPAVTQDAFLCGEAIDDALLPDVEWRRPDGAPMRDEDWRDGGANTLIAALYARQSRVMLVFHRGAYEQRVVLPPARMGLEWRVALSTDAAQLHGERATIAPRSVVALCEEVSAGARYVSAQASAEQIEALAAAAGVETRWRGVDGAEREVPRETLDALLASLGLPAGDAHDARASLSELAQREDRRALPQSAVFYDAEEMFLRLPSSAGKNLLRLTLSREDGGEETIDLRADALHRVAWRGLDGRRCEGLRAKLPKLPLGRHRLSLGDATCRVTVAPRRCYWPQQQDRAFGLSAQLYSLRRAGDQGVGDFTTLAQLGALAARSGASMVAINPLHALFSQKRERASPYYPSDRLFLEPFYLDVAELVEFNDAVEACGQVDYAAVATVKTRAFMQSFAAFEDFSQRQPGAAQPQEFARFVTENGAALEDFARFETLNEIYATAWPQSLRDRDPDALDAFAREHATRIRYHKYLQWRCDLQFARAAQSAADSGLALGFCRDLAVGAAPDGAESWRNAAQLLQGFAIGAPPDAFSRDGQVWGLPPPNPLSWKADGGAQFASLLRANMRRAGALRVDHVMGLARLFVVPHGAKASQGAYLSYPQEHLFAEIALESQRARCIVVGEDLGTLPWGFGDRLSQSGVLSYRVLWFEREGRDFAPPCAYAQAAMACVSTHDLPTLRGWWDGADIAEKLALGLIDESVARQEQEARREDRAALLRALAHENILHTEADAPYGSALAVAITRFIARTPSLLAMAQLDDLADERIAVNLPGTDMERPNWRRKLGGELDEIFASEGAQAILRALRRNVVQIAAS